MVQIFKITVSRLYIYNRKVKEFQLPLKIIKILKYIRLIVFFLEDTSGIGRTKYTIYVI